MGSAPSRRCASRGSARPRPRRRCRRTRRRDPRRSRARGRRACRARARLMARRRADGELRSTMRERAPEARLGNRGQLAAHRRRIERAREVGEPDAQHVAVLDLGDRAPHRLRIVVDRPRRAARRGRARDLRVVRVGCDLAELDEQIDQLGRVDERAREVRAGAEQRAEQARDRRVARRAAARSTTPRRAARSDRRARAAPDRDPRDAAISREQLRADARGALGRGGRRAASPAGGARVRARRARR